MRFFLQDMAMQGAAKGLERKIPQVGFEIAKVTQKHNRFKIRLDLHYLVLFCY